MKRVFNLLIGCIVTVAMLAALPVHAAPDSWKDLQSLPFPENYPTKEAAQRLNDEMLFHRATQVVGWSLPAMTL